jgi:hypothetical protein
MRNYIVLTTFGFVLSPNLNSYSSILHGAISQKTVIFILVAVKSHVLYVGHMNLRLENIKLKKIIFYEQKQLRPSYYNCFYLLAYFPPV